MTHQQKRPSVRPEKPRWFHELRDEAVGPVDEPALRKAAREGDLTRYTLVWRKGLDGWQPAAAVPEVLAIVEQEAGVLRAAFEPPAVEPPPDAAGVPAQVCVPTTSEALADGSAGARPSDASARQGRSRPPPKPSLPELTDDHGLGDAVSEEEERERPIREADVRELLERTRSTHPSRGPGSRSPSESGAAASQPRRSSMPASAASERAPELGRVDTGPAPAPARTLPIWAKAMGVVALFLLGMGAVLLTGRPRGAAETAGAEPPDRSATAKKPSASTEPAEVGEVRRAADAGEADRTASTVPARAAGTGEPGRAPAVVSIQGPLSPSVFQKQLDHATAMFDEQCWQRLRAAEGEVAENPSISVELGISAWGQIEKLVAGEAPAGYRDVGRCIIGRIRGWKFPRAAARTRATLRIAPSAR